MTQAALNGVARYAGHALQIMALVRPAAPSAFEGLTQLVDFYMYCAFTLFCPQWTIDGELFMESSVIGWCFSHIFPHSRRFTCLGFERSCVWHVAPYALICMGAGMIWVTVGTCGRW